jgi:hypothetical protein
MTYARILTVCDELISCTNDYVKFAYFYYNECSIPDACSLVDNEGEEIGLDALYVKRNINGFIIPRWRRYFAFGITRSDHTNYLRGFTRMMSENRHLYNQFECVTTTRNYRQTKLLEMDDLDKSDNLITYNKYEEEPETIILYDPDR